MGQLLPENSTLARRLRRAAQGGALPHAIIFSGSGDRMAAARFAAAAMECQAEGGRPCLQCRQCRKVMEDIHPDVQTVQDPDHRELPVDLLRRLRQDAYIRPNDGAAKVYIFPDCDALNQRDQNVLLKLVEEGPPYAAFLFCAETAASLLPTIRSRCVEWKLRGGDEDARDDAEVFKSSALLSAQQAKRDAVLAFSQAVQKEFEKLLASDISKALDEKALADLIRAALRGEDPAAYAAEVSQVTDGIRAELARELEAGLEIRPSKKVGAGFRLAAKDGSGYFDCSQEEIARMLDPFFRDTRL